MNYFLKMIPLFCLIIVACASRDAGWEKKTESISLSSSETTKLKKEAMEFWKNRSVKADLENALKRFESLHAANPSDLEPLIYLTRGYYFCAEYHHENVANKKKYYEKGASYGEMAMATNAEFKQSIKSGKTVDESLKKLKVTEVPALYWTAANLGKWAKATGIAATLKFKTSIKAMVERVETLDPHYFFGAHDRYWGGYFAIAPNFAGGDMKRSKVHFDKSIVEAPDYLGTKVLMAEVYWTKEGNKQEFDKLLKDVLASKADSHPEIGPENIMEKKKAEKLLKNINELF